MAATACTCAADVGELYDVLSHRLERIVRGDVRAPEPVIEDACQFAWSKLVDHRDRVRREAVLAWLATTAVREAWRLIRRDGRELSLEAIERPADIVGSPGCGPDELVERRERLESIRSLPERQQRLLWLAALGLSYNEMAHHTGCTQRTVERQLLRAKERMRALAAE